MLYRLLIRNMKEEKNIIKDSNKKTCQNDRFNFCMDYALSTKPDLRQLVQTCIFLAPPLTLHLTLFTLEFQILLVFL